MSVGDDALASKTTYGPSPRGERSWIARAASSLPVPDSPTTSTVASVFAAASITAKTARILSE
jgi:hypothetical protein